MYIFWIKDEKDKIVVLEHNVTRTEVVKLQAELLRKYSKSNISIFTALQDKTHGTHDSEMCNECIRLLTNI